MKIEIDLEKILQGFVCHACGKKGEVLFNNTIECKRCWDWLEELNEDGSPKLGDFGPRSYQDLKKYLILIGEKNATNQTIQK